MPRICFGIRVDGTRPAVGVTGQWSPTGYEDAVEHWLKRIAGTFTGKALLKELHPANRLLIVPDTGEAGTPGTGPEGRSAAAWRDAIREGAVARGGSGRPFGGFGTGRGTNASIEFTPLDFFNSPPQEQPDMVLVHEICHATRYLRGIVSNQPMGKFGFLTREEVHAILITNIYRSEQQLREFRLSHRPARYGSLQQAQSTFRLGPHLIRLLASRQETLFGTLSRINTAFNPIREMATARSA